MASTEGFIYAIKDDSVRCFDVTNASVPFHQGESYAFGIHGGPVSFMSISRARLSGQLDTASGVGVCAAQPNDSSPTVFWRSLSVAAAQHELKLKQYVDF